MAEWAGHGKPRQKRQAALEWLAKITDYARHLARRTSCSAQ